MGGFIRWWLCFVGVFLCLHCAVAQPDKVGTLPEVEVTATRVEAFGSGKHIVKADSILLQLHGQDKLTDLLHHLAPIYIKSYGQSNLATLSMRGASANQVAIVWNGIQLNSATTGISDLNLLPVTAADQASLVYGPASAMYGSGAIGGSILLENQPQLNPQNYVQVQQQIGSFKSTNTSLCVLYRQKAWSTSGSYQYQSAKNNFPFINYYLPGNPIQRTSNAGLAQHNLVQNVYIPIGKRAELRLHAWFTQSQQQIPPVMSVPKSSATQQDQNLRLCAVYLQTTNLGQRTFRIASLNEQLLYQNPDAFLTSSATVHTRLAEIDEKLKFGKTLVNVGANVKQIGAQSTEYTKQQWQASVFVSATKIVANQNKVSVAFRKEYTKGFDPNPTVSLGFETPFKFLQHVKFKAQIANSYRVPTLNERYWNPGGNPALRPEKGLTIESGLDATDAQLLGVKISSGLTVYRAYITDMILWRPVNGYIYSPYNIANAQTNGLESNLQISDSLQFNLFSYWQLSGSYNYTVSAEVINHEVQQTQLPYVPLHSAQLRALLTGSKGTIMWYSASFSTVFTNTKNTHFLKAYTLHDFVISSTAFQYLSAEFKVQAACKNVFNTTYQNVQNVPLPGRHFTLTLQLNFKTNKPTNK